MVKLKLTLIDAKDQERTVEVVSVSRVEAFRLAQCSYPDTVGALLNDQSSVAKTDISIREV